MKIKTFYIFLLLCIVFITYSVSFYTKETDVKYKIQFSESSVGKLYWQKYNCQSCHQIYSLGGYLGPDLTNVYSKYNKNDAVIKSFMKGGFKQMPTFNLTENEQNALLDFLKDLDKTGSSDHRTFRKLKDGMIKQDGK